MRKLHLYVGMMLLMLTQLAIAQRTISGRVVNSADQMPVSGASVRIKGTKTGTVTGADGSFSLSTTTANPVLEFSSVGFLPRSLPVENGATISMDVDARALSEVVVTGTGVATSRKKLGISVESITADKLPPVPNASIDQALVGKVPGALIQSIDGTPGSRTQIILRGINTLQGGTKPLILLDGVQINTDINQLDLSNIERVEVVQGAASATLYGAQGANGVIQLFSKKGRRGQISINASSSYSSDEYLNVGNLHKAKMHGYLVDASGNVVDRSGNIAKLDDYGIYQEPQLAFTAGVYPSAQLNPNNVYNHPYDKNLRYYDHFSQMFAKAHSRNHTLNILGGGDRVDFNVSMSNNHQESAIAGNGYVDRINFSSNVGAELFKGFRLRSITQLVYAKNTLNPFFRGGGNSIFDMLNLAPFYDLNQRLPDGTLPYYLGNDISTHSVNGENTKYYFDYTQGRDYTVDIIQSLSANYTVNKFLDLEAKYGINHIREDDNWIMKDQSQNLNVQYEQTWASQYNGDDPNGEIDNFNYKTTLQNFLASAYIKTDFQRDFHSKLPITTSTQFSFDYRNSKNSQYITYGKHLQPYPIYNMNQTATQGVPPGGDVVRPFITYGYLVNQKVDVGDYGGFSVGFRRDFSSAFGSGDKPANFPRADVYIRPSSFGFWNNGLGNVIKEFKLRAAYGEAGIQPGAFDRYRTIGASNVGTGQAYSYPTTPLNFTGLRVEKSKEFEAGTDISFSGFKGNWFTNIALSGTYWTRKGEDVIYDVSAIPSSGVVLNKRNAIGLSSKGVQASLNLDVFKSRNFSYNLTTNFGSQVSKIDKIAGGVDIILTSSAGSTSLVLTEGQRIGQLFGYKLLRSLDATRKDGTPYIAKADQGKYQLVNGIVVDTASKQMQFTNETYPLGTGQPKFNMSFVNTFTFKDIITVGFQLDWVHGNYLYNQTKEWMYRDGIHGDWDNPVTINGQTAAYTAFYRSAYSAIFGQPNGAGRNATKDYFLEDASFLRLRNVNLGVDIAKIANIRTFKRLQLVLSGRNLWTDTKYSGFDPEISSGTDTYSAFDRGIDHNSMPNVKSYQIGLNIGF